MSVQRCFQVAAEARDKSPAWLDQPCQVHGHRQTAQQAIDAFLPACKDDGTLHRVGWWQAANAYTAIALKDIYCGNTRNYGKVAECIRKCASHPKRPGLINVFNDDSLWWALCCLHMYRASGEGKGEESEWFLNTAKAIWKHVRDRKNVVQAGELQFDGQDLEGGLWWKSAPASEENNIASIAAAVWTECSVRLALIESKKAPEHRRHDDPSVQEYLNAAQYTLHYLLRVRYRPQQGVFLGGLDLENNHARNHTFCNVTGTMIATCALLYEAIRKEEHIQLAIFLAHKSMQRDQWVEENGVLTEMYRPGGNKSPTENDNTIGSKSVLIRHLGTLYEVLHRTGYQSKAQHIIAMIRQFININFKSQLERNSDGQGHFGPWWNGPFEHPSNFSQFPVLDVMAAVILVNQ